MSIQMPSKPIRLTNSNKLGSIRWSVVIRAGSFRWSFALTRLGRMEGSVSISRDLAPGVMPVAVGVDRKS